MSDLYDQARDRMLKARRSGFDPNQPRDEDGRWVEIRDIVPDQDIPQLVRDADRLGHGELAGRIQGGAVGERDAEDLRRLSDDAGANVFNRNRFTAASMRRTARHAGELAARLGQTGPAGPRQERGVEEARQTLRGLIEDGAPHAWTRLVGQKQTTLTLGGLRQAARSAGAPDEFLSDEFLQSIIDDKVGVGEVKEVRSRRGVRRYVRA